MPRKPRLIDMLGPDKPERRPLVTHDGTLLDRGESYPIAGEPIAMDKRPKPSLAAVTFDGAMPPRKS